MVVEYDYKNPFRQCRISKADIVTNFICSMEGAE